MSDFIGPVKNVTISDKVRIIENRVRGGEQFFPLDTKQTLDAIGEGMANNIKRQLAKGNIERAIDVNSKMKGAIDRLDRFDVLTNESREAMKQMLDNELRKGLK